MVSIIWLHEAYYPLLDPHKCINITTSELASSKREKCKSKFQICTESAVAGFNHFVLIFDFLLKFILNKFSHIL